jgi:2-keto-4-pentenoate hydratase/2-oxohepta-3-ene-1,7-dioic acid hydratase in catechol pathway
MKLARFSHDGRTQFGAVIGDAVAPLGTGDTIDFIAQWTAEAPIPAATIPLTDVSLLAPVQRPGKIFAIGLNYRDHVEESGMEVPKEQVWFTKAVTAIAGPTDTILIPRVSDYVDYEVELVAVIGRRGKNISAADAPGHIFGYCTGNDVTERMWQHRGPQWSLGKSFDTHAPIGPWIVTADEIGDPHTLDVQCFVNDDQRQSSNTRHLIFNIWQQIEHLSAAMTLEPGDLIFTGTPGGVGAARDPRLFLAPGDVVRTVIPGIGELRNVVAKEV